MKVLSTYRILKSKACNENIDEAWIDWAIEMIEAGFESGHLYMLAGESKPYNQFALQQLTDNILRDLRLDYSDREAVMSNYIRYLITVSVDRPETYYSTLRELKDVCQDSELDPRYIAFYLLYYAKDDLLHADVQWYWEGADRDNIDAIINAEFRAWLVQNREDHLR